MIRVETEGFRELDGELKSASVRSGPFKRAMGKAAMTVKKEVQREVSGQALQRRTGQLRKSIGYRLLSTVHGVEGEVWARRGFAVVHETGATITAKSERGLIFPVLRSAGGGGLIRGVALRQTKSQARRLATKEGAAMSGVYRHTRTKGGVVKYRKGDRYYTNADLKSYRNRFGRAAQRAVDSGAAEGAWVRVMSVRIPRRPFLEPAARDTATEVAEYLGNGFMPRLAR